MTFQFNRRWFTSVALSVAAALVLTFSACTQPESEPLPQADAGPAAEEVALPAAEEATAHPAVQQEASPPAPTNPAASEPATEEPDPFVVPDGSPEELLEYVKGLMDVRPKSNDQAGFTEYRKGIGGALVTAADRILAQTPTDEQAKEAVILLLNGLTALDSTGDADAKKRLQGLPAELEKAGLSKLVRIAQSFSLQGKLQRARGMQPDGIFKVLAEVEAFFADGTVQGEDINMAMMAGMMAESTGDVERTVELYKKLGTIISAHEDKAIASMGAKLVGAGRRIGLVGNKMPLEGVTLEGEPLDWSKYEGKVVLVDFWATWCGPCIQEMPNIRKNYDAYHDRGFDVIGISIDQDRGALVSFVNEHEEPWTVLCDRDLAKSQTGEMMSDRYGVFSIPTMVLIGADGKVVAMNPRGPQLGQELEKLLGPAEAKKPAEAQKPAEVKKPAEAKKEKLPAPKAKPASDTEKTKEQAAGEEKSAKAESNKK